MVASKLEVLRHACLFALIVSLGTAAHALAQQTVASSFPDVDANGDAVPPTLAPETPVNGDLDLWMRSPPL